MQSAEYGAKTEGERNPYGSLGVVGSYRLDKQYQRKAQFFESQQNENLQLSPYQRNKTGVGDSYAQLSALYTSYHQAPHTDIGRYRRLLLQVAVIATDLLFLYNYIFALLK